VNALRVISPGHTSFLVLKGFILLSSFLFTRGKAVSSLGYHLSRIVAFGLAAPFRMSLISTWSVLVSFRERLHSGFFPGGSAEDSRLPFELFTASFNLLGKGIRRIRSRYRLHLPPCPPPYEHISRPLNPRTPPRMNFVFSWNSSLGRLMRVSRTIIFLIGQHLSAARDRSSFFE